MKLKYEKEMITERDYYNMLNTAKADGMAEGEAKGLAEGRAEIIRKMQDSGMDNETILRITGISPESIPGISPESILRLSRDA